MAKSPLKIGDRVRLRGRSECASVFANPYSFKGKRRVGVVWDHQPGHVLTVAVGRLEIVVPEHARPVSVGALQHDGRHKRMPQAVIKSVTVNGKTFVPVTGLGEVTRG